MIVTRASIFTGIEHSLDLPITQEQLDLYESGALLVQEAFPQLSAPQREFIKTGLTPEEAKTVLGPRPRNKRRRKSRQ